MAEYIAIADYKRGVVKVEYEYVRTGLWGHFLFGKYFNMHVRFIQRTGVHYWLFGLLISLILTVGNAVWNIMLLNLNFVFVVYFFLVLNFLTWDVKRTKEALQQFEGIVNTLLSFTLLLVVAFTASISATFLFFVNIFTILSLTCISALHPKAQKFKKFTYLFSTSMLILMFLLVFFGKIPIVDVRRRIDIYGKTIDLSSLQTILSNILSLTVLNLRHNFADFCMHGAVSNIKFVVLFINPVDDTDGTESKTDLLGDKIIEIDVKKQLVRQEYRYDITKTIGYRLVGRYHVYHQRGLKYHNCGKIYYILSNIVLVSGAVGNTVWNVVALNVLIYLMLAYNVFMLSSNFDIYLFKRCLMQFEGGVNLLFAFLVLINVSATAHDGSVILFFVYMVLHEIEVVCQSALHPKLRRTHGWNQLFHIVALIVVAWLIFFDVAKVRDIVFTGTFGKRTVVLSSLQTLLSHIFVVVILSIIQLRMVFFIETGGANIRYNVEFVKTGTLRRLQMKPSVEATFMDEGSDDDEESSSPV